MAKFLDENCTTQLVSKIMSRTSTLGGRSIWSGGNLNTSQLHISSYFKGYRFTQLGSRFRIWCTQPSEFQISAGGSRNIDDLYWLGSTRASNGSTSYDPDNVIFGIEYEGDRGYMSYILFHEIAVIGSGSAGAIAISLYGTTYRLDEGNNVVLKGVNVNIAGSSGISGTLTANAVEYDILASSSGGDTGGDELDVYEARVSDSKPIGPGSSLSNALQEISLTKENTVLRLNVSLSAGLMTTKLYIANFSIGSNRLPHYHVTVFVNSGTWTTSNGDDVVFKFYFPRVAKGVTSTGPLTVTATEPTVTTTNQTQQAATYRYVNMKMPRSNNAFTVDLYQTDTNSSTYVGIVNPLTTYGLWVSQS